MAWSRGPSSGINEFRRLAALQKNAGPQSSRGEGGGNRNGSRAWKQTEERVRKRNETEGDDACVRNGAWQGEGERQRPGIGFSGSGALIHLILCALKRRSIKVEKSQRDSTRGPRRMAGAASASRGCRRGTR